MSRGLGKVQRFVLDALEEAPYGPQTITYEQDGEQKEYHYDADGVMTTWQLTERWVGHRDGIPHYKTQPTENDRSTVERAARSLRDKGLIDSHHLTRQGKPDDPKQGRRWRRKLTPEEAKEEKRKLGF